MKFKEYLALYKNLIKSKSLVILRCPYCDSFDITYHKDTLEEEKYQLDKTKDFREIKYTISCNKCHSACIVKEYWGK